MKYRLLSKKAKIALCVFGFFILLFLSAIIGLAILGW